MLIADLHIHSHYSRATSGDCCPEALDLWARRKGIGLVGSGDFTHPAWRMELREKLQPAEEGLYTLREAYRRPAELAGEVELPRFVITGEISSIYKKGGRVRKVHNLILLPGLDAAERLANRLEQVGNLHSDGRPILGLDSRDLLEITLECCPEAVFIPAHIWTPHFSLFGAFSGFDAIEECFEDLTPHIHALETGLSSDPPMNWRVSALDRFALVSNSDAHSPSKLGREANLLEIEPSYPNLAAALHGKEAPGFAGTIEFYPEEGKYHWDGHRKCGVCLKPTDTDAAGGICPVCKKKLTIGVSHRVEQLADREEGFVLSGAAPYESLVPLPEIIAASLGCGPASARVQTRYLDLLRELGPEFRILREIPIEQIERAAGRCIAEGVRRVRDRQVNPVPGYDGEYGVIKILDESEISRLSGQMSLFSGEPAKSSKPVRPRVSAKRAVAAAAESAQALPSERVKTSLLSGLNTDQREAVTAGEREVAVVAGPGTGKTRTLVARIAWLVESCGADPAGITAVTFTNQAAGEMRERLEQYFGDSRMVGRMTIGTFHAIGLQLLREAGKDLPLIDEYAAADLAAQVLQEAGCKLSPRRAVQEISRHKNGEPLEQLPKEVFDACCIRLQKDGVRDFDDLLLDTAALFEGQQRPETDRFQHLLVDEFQDINEIQYRLLLAWSRESRGLFVIGDPDQAIYGFRGSDAHCFERFRMEFPAAKWVRLTENYRSTPQILGCAVPVINRNPAPDGPRILKAQRAGGKQVRLVTVGDGRGEGIFVAKEINRMVGGIDMLDAQEQSHTGGGRGFSEIAVLYRTHRQAQELEYCLKQEGIPYVVTGREKLLADPQVRGAVNFFRSLLDPADTVSLKSCLQEVFSCPEQTVRTLLESCCGRPETGRLSAAVERLPVEAPGREEILYWSQLAKRFGARAQREKPQKLLEEWMAEWGLSESPVLEKLCGMAVFQDSMAAFLENLRFGKEGDLARSGSRAYTPDAVRLMTLHGSKGLEYPVVFLCGVNRGTIPLDSPGRAGDPGEERRLFYVGMTRAKEELILLAGPEPSPFLKELPAQLLEHENAVQKRELPAGVQLCFF